MILFLGLVALVLSTVLVLKLVAGVIGLVLVAIAIPLALFVGIMEEIRDPTHHKRSKRNGKQ